MTDDATAITTVEAAICRIGAGTKESRPVNATATDSPTRRATKVYKARPTGGQTIPDLRIEATEEIPDARPSGKFDMAEHCAMLDADAEKIVNAMRTSLPQGVVGRVFARLAAEYATDLAVRWEQLGGQQA